MAWLQVVARSALSDKARYTCLSTDTKITDSTIFEGDICKETDGSSDDFEYDGDSWAQKGAGGAGLVAEVGLISQRHNRSTSVSIDTTHPGNDTTSFTWTQAENVRRYRVLPIAGTDGDLVKVVEDAVNGTQADAWLAEGENLDSDCEYWIAHLGVWSEWKELSKDPEDDSLSRLDFELFTGGTAVIDLMVEAE